MVKINWSFDVTIVTSTRNNHCQFQAYANMVKKNQININAINKNKWHIVVCALEIMHTQLHSKSIAMKSAITILLAENPQSLKIRWHIQYSEQFLSKYNSVYACVHICYFRKYKCQIFKWIFRLKWQVFLISHSVFLHSYLHRSQHVTVLDFHFHFLLLHHCWLMTLT